MADFKAKGIDEYISALEKYSDRADGIIKQAVYDGAGVMAQAAERAIKALPEEDFRYAFPDHPLTGITAEQKEDLVNGFGITHFSDTLNNSPIPYTHVKLGFDGYGRTSTNVFGWDKTKGKATQHGKLPNIVLARAVESGTSFRVKHPFMRQAVNTARAETTRVMTETVDTETKKIVK